MESIGISIPLNFYAADSKGSDNGYDGIRNNIAEYLQKNPGYDCVCTMIEKYEKRVTFNLY